MMKKSLVFICRNQEVQLCMERIFSKNEKFNVMIVTELKELYIYLTGQFYDGVLLGSGFTEEEEKNIQDWMKQYSPDTRLIKHYGGGSGLLMNELQIAFSKV